MVLQRTFTEPRMNPALCARKGLQSRSRQEPPTPTLLLLLLLLLGLLLLLVLGRWGGTWLLLLTLLVLLCMPSLCSNLFKTLQSISLSSSMVTIIPRKGGTKEKENNPTIIILCGSCIIRNVRQASVCLSGVCVLSATQRMVSETDLLHAAYLSALEL
ncbi:hypothetical protein FKM82_029282 [Ascaphus truei]